MRLRTVFALLPLLMICGATAGAQDPVEPAAKPPSGRISGRVVAADSGKPIRWAVVHLVSPQGRQHYASTDPQGRYEFTGLTPGNYSVDVRAERYLPMSFDNQPYDGRSAVVAKTIPLSEGEQFDRGDVSLPRAGAVDGRVLDEFGDGAPNITVQISRLEYAAGRRRLMPIGGRTPMQPTDDKGHFRIYGLQPGEYYVTALAGAFTEQNDSGGFAPTYYPGSPDPSGAQQVRVGYGADATDVVIQLVPAKSARIAGRMLDASGRPVASGTVMLSIRDTPGISAFMLARVATESDGSFMLRNVPPGSYTLQGFGRQTTNAGNLGASEFGWLPVVLDGVDQTDLVLAVRKGPALRGRIVLDDNAGPPISPRDVRISTVPIEFESAPVGGGPSPSVTDEDWTFEVSNQSGQRLVRPSIRAQGWTLKRITHGSRDMTDGPFDLRKTDINDVEVLLTSRGPSLSGAVTGAEGKPSTDAAIVVFAADDTKWTDRSRFVALTRPAPDGRYTVKGLPPEDYLVIALPSVNGSEWQDPQFLENLRSGATPVTLVEGAAAVQDLTMTVRQ